MHTRARAGGVSAASGKLPPFIHMTLARMVLAHLDNLVAGHAADVGYLNAHLHRLATLATTTSGARSARSAGRLTAPATRGWPPA